MSDSSDNTDKDIFGFGKVAKAIPPEVYVQTAAVTLETFQKILSPITATTSGLGRYIDQKFGTMVEIQKATAIITVQEAVTRAKEKAQRRGQSLRPPTSLKAFVKSLEEASNETDVSLHDMWTNLIASQLVDETCHPHFVQILPHFSPAEAKLLVSLLPLAEVGENSGGYMVGTGDIFTHWVVKSGDDPKPWSISCTLLFEFRLVDLAAPKGNNPENAAIIYLTALGSAFLAAVTTMSSN